MSVEVFDLIILGFVIAVAIAVFIGFSGEAKKMYRSRDDYDVRYDPGYDRHYHRKRSRHGYGIKKRTH